MSFPVHPSAIASRHALAITSRASSALVPSLVVSAVLCLGLPAGHAQTRDRQPAATAPVEGAPAQEAAVDASASTKLKAVIPPKKGDRDPGGPGMGGGVAAFAAAIPDLALIGSFRLATVVIPWGTSATVSADDAAFKKLGLCSFRYLYRTRNQGAGGAAATSNRIMRDHQAGPVLATKALPALAPGAVAGSDGHVSLKPGTWMLYVHADAPLTVGESDEANNLRRVRVTVKGDCG
jgi:hypothetical protein